MTATSCAMKTHDLIILVLTTILTGFGILSFFFTPTYVKGAELVIGAIIESLAMVMAFKFGVHVATPPPGTNQITATETPVEPVKP